MCHGTIFLCLGAVYNAVDYIITLSTLMPSFFPGAREQHAPAMALLPRVCRGTSLSLANLLSGTALGFSIMGRGMLPGQLSSLLGVLHLFTLLGMSIVILCNTTTFLFLSHNSDFYYVFLIETEKDTQNKFLLLIPQIPEWSEGACFTYISNYPLTPFHLSPI